ncbi:MAG: magnesium transporter MgtE N-terminal domain-containing protein [Kiloniellaceae bacterium]
MNQQTPTQSDNTGIDLHDPEAVRRFVEVAHPVDAAALLEGLPPVGARDALLAMPLERRTEIFGYLRVDTQVALAQTFHRGQLAAIVTEMSADDRADLFNRLAPDQQEALLPGLAQAEREDIRRLAGHAEGSAGAI